MLLGCYFASKDAYKLAGQLHPAFRGKVLCVSRNECLSRACAPYASDFRLSAVRRLSTSTRYLVASNDLTADHLWKALLVEDGP